MPIIISLNFRTEKDKANEHLLTGTYKAYVTETKRSSTQYFDAL